MADLSRTPARRIAAPTCAQAVLTIRTHGEGFTDISRELRAFLIEIGARAGLAHLFCRHTSASLTIQENADPDVRTDLLTALKTLAPRSGRWVHDLEGPDDMPAHIRTMLPQSGLAVPVANGTPLLGTWQAVYLIEHRDRGHAREVVLSFLGDCAES